MAGSWPGEHPKKNWDPLRIFATAEASNFKFGTQIGFGTNLPKTTFWTKIGGGSGPREHRNKIWDPLRISATVEANNFEYGTQIGFGTTLAKKHLRPKLEGVWARDHPEKFGTPYLFMQPLKLATSNLVHNLGLGLAYQKTTFWTKIGGDLGKGSMQTKFGTPYVFLQPLKLTTSNVVHKLGLEVVYQKTTFRTKIGGGLG